jgi:hypothetical protein
MRSPAQKEGTSTLLAGRKLAAIRMGFVGQT